MVVGTLFTFSFSLILFLTTCTSEKWYTKLPSEPFQKSIFPLTQKNKFYLLEMIVTVLTNLEEAKVGLLVGRKHLLRKDSFE